MSNGEPQKVVQIPEDTFRKMREKLKKQDERIKTLENQIVTNDLEKTSDSGGSPEEKEKLNARINELEALAAAQRNQIDSLSSQTESPAASNAELEEKNALIKYLSEREKKLMEALESKSHQSGPGGTAGAHLEKGFQLLQKFELELNKRSTALDSMFSQVYKMKEVMNHLEQELQAIPTKDDLDNKVKELIASVDPATLNQEVPGMNITYEVLLERIKGQLAKSIEMKEKVGQEYEVISKHKKGLDQRIDFLSSNLDGINGTIKEKEDRLNSAREYFEAKYIEWKAQDEARAREMESLWGMIGTD